MGTYADLIALGRRLVAGGYQVGENPLFGGVTAGAHVAGSAHYTGDALDINYDGHGQAVETSMLQKIVPMAKALGLRVIWQTTGHYDHIHIDDRPGPDIGKIGYTPPSSTAKPAALSTTPVGLVPSISMGEIGGALTKVLITGTAVAAGAGLVLLGLNRATGNPAGKAAEIAL
jgi:hypothetical protein